MRISDLEGILNNERNVMASLKNEHDQVLKSSSGISQNQELIKNLQDSLKVMESKCHNFAYKEKRS